MVKTNCKDCGIQRIFPCPAEERRRNKTGYCRNCYIKNFPNGKKAPAYKRGYFIRSGYKFILKPSHPFCNNLGYVREHRLVVEKNIGRFLKPEEVIHHINGNRLDNRIENLEITNQQNHAKLHNKKNRTCDLCDKKHIARGFCTNHYWVNFLKNHRYKKRTDRSLSIYSKN